MTDPDDLIQFETLPEDPEQVPHSVYTTRGYGDPDDIFGPDRKRRLPFPIPPLGKTIRYGGITALIVLIGIIAINVLQDDEPVSGIAPAPAPTRAVPTLPTSPLPPTAVPDPTATPLPTAQPVSVLGHTAPLAPAQLKAPSADATTTPQIAGTPAPAPELTPRQRSLIAAFASCDGRYQGDALEARLNTARAALATGVKTDSHFLEIALEDCDYTAEELPTPQPATPTPQPTVAPISTPAPPTPVHSTTLLMELPNARWLSHNNPQAISTLSSLTWTLSPLDNTAAGITTQLLHIAVEQPTLLQPIAEMPFLKTPDPFDLQALLSIRVLLQERPQELSRILSHPTLAGGITDAWTPVIAVLHHDPHPTELLNPSLVTTETTHLSTDYGSTTHVAIVRTRGGAPDTMDAVSQAAARVESYMAVPLPTGAIIVHFSDRNAPSSPAVNLSTHIAVRPVYDTSAETAVRQGLHQLIAHEIAHYYWTANPVWLDEGIAQVISYAAEQDRTGHPVAAITPPCPEIAHLSALERALATQQTISPHCEYAIGERLFLEIQHIVGEPAFRSQLQQLFQLSQDRDDPLTIKDVRHTMGDHPHARERINHWYLGESTDQSDLPYARIDISPPQPALPTINGIITGAHLSTRYQGEPTIQFSASQHRGPAYITIAYDHRVAGDPRTADLEIVEYFEDGFATRRTPHTIVAASQHSGGSFWLPVGPPDNTAWRTGSYWAMVYHQGHKVAQIHWNVTP